MLPSSPVPIPRSMLRLAHSLAWAKSAVQSKPASRCRLSHRPRYAFPVRYPPALSAAATVLMELTETGASSTPASRIKALSVLMRAARVLCVVGAYLSSMSARSPISRALRDRSIRLAVSSSPCLYSRRGGASLRRTRRVSTPMLGPPAEGPARPAALPLPALSTSSARCAPPPAAAWSVPRPCRPDASDPVAMHCAPAVATAAVPAKIAPARIALRSAAVEPADLEPELDAVAGMRAPRTGRTCSVSPKSVQRRTATHQLLRQRGADRRAPIAGREARRRPP